jgi:Secretion system C-terminal sorting domain
MTKKNTTCRLIVLLLAIVLFAQTKATAGGLSIKVEIPISDSLMYLNIPLRPKDAIEGSDFVDKITSLNLKDREKAIVKEILSGNVPSFSRKLRPLRVSKTIGTDNYELTFYTVCDYMAIGSEEDYLYVPMTPSTAQFLADQLDCSLPTSKIVDIIYAGSGLKLNPQPIPPSDKMITVPVFNQHTDSIKQQITQVTYDRSKDNIIAGHKKDIIISNKIYNPDRSYARVVIYGWHLGVNNPIQPVYNGHFADYADYSHGVRLISNIAFINNDSVKVVNILRNEQLSALFSNEGIISKPYYPASDFLTSMRSRSSYIRPNFKLYQNYPNPFNPKTNIEYELPKPSSVNIVIYNSLGRELKTMVNKYESAGRHNIKFDGSNFSNGIYFYQIIADEFVETKKLVLLK